MGYERDYEYGPIPTEPTGQPPVTPQRKRCRGSVIARFGVLLAAAWIATWAVRQYTLQRATCTDEGVARLGHLPISTLSMPLPPHEVSPAELKIQEVEGDYDRGKLIECFAPKDHDDANGPARIPLPKITLSGDSVYFFDVPPRFPHRRDDEDLNPHKKPRWNTAGKFTLETSDDVEEVTVKASVGVADGGLFARVCTFEREDGAKGVGIVVPDEEPQVDRLNLIRFAVKVPAKAEFKQFETVLWNWTHSISDISDSSFRSFSLAGVNGNIHVEHIAADAVNATTINGNITGTWGAHDNLLLATVNGGILVDVDFKSTTADGTAVVALHTTKGPVLADIALGTTDDKFPGNFLVNAGSVAAPVSVNIITAPVGSVLNMTASSISAPVEVLAHPTFEGTFDARTWGPSQQAEVQVRQGIEDPTGRGRQRNVSSHTVNVPFGHGIAGEVYWGAEVPENPGHVRVSTLFAPVKLVF